MWPQCQQFMAEVSGMRGTDRGGMTQRDRFMRRLVSCQISHYHSTNIREAPKYKSESSSAEQRHRKRPVTKELTSTNHHIYPQFKPSYWKFSDMLDYNARSINYVDYLSWRWDKAVKNNDYKFHMIGGYTPLQTPPVPWKAWAQYSINVPDLICMWTIVHQYIINF